MLDAKLKHAARDDTEARRLQLKAHQFLTGGQPAKKCPTSLVVAARYPQGG